MKKLLVTVALLGAVAYSYGQGTLLVGNSGNLISFKPLAGSAAAIPGSTTAVYRFAVIYAPEAAVLPQFTEGMDVAAYLTGLGAFSVAPTLGINHATAAGRVIFPVGAEGLLLPGLSGGNATSLMMAGWLDTGGLVTWADARNSTYFGTSAEATLAVGGGSTPPPALFGVGAGQVTGFTVFQVIPEPSSFALAGLGAAALLIFRRRN